MTFFRTVFTSVLCAVLSVPVWADKGSEYRQGGQAISHGLTGTGNQIGGATNTTNTCSTVQHIGNNCTSNTGTGKCNCQRYEGKGAARKCVSVGCSVKQCNKGLNFHYNQFEDGKPCLYGASSQQAGVEDEEYPLYSGIKVTICGSKGFCGSRPSCKEGEVAPKFKLSDGTIVFAGCYDVSTFTRTCPSGQIFKDDNSTECVPCKSCDPINANCKETGSDGISKCYYETSCKDGFEKEQHKGEYNPSCSAKPRTKCTDTELKELGATEGEFKGGKCIAKKCKSNTAIIKEGKCVECEPCNATNATCELSVKNNKCVYITRCKDNFVDIQNDGKPDASCSPKAPDEYNIIYELDGGTGCDDAPRKYTSGQSIKIDCVPTRGGYEVEEWVLDETGSPIIKMPYTIPADAKGDKRFIVGWKKIETPDPECPSDADREKYPHADRFELKENVCKPTHCEGDYELDTDTDQCKEKEKVECPSDADKEKYPHADQFKFEDGKCEPTHCEKGYKLEKGKCVEDGIKEAEEDYKDAKDRETSFENRMLGGLTMAATGIGGMELAQGLAEQSADAAADRDMQAYLATFQCKVGDKRYSGGTMGVETGGANQLIDLYQQYVELAADLKERKAALGIKSGIESEVILDKANTGLYDDVGHGIENGTYASLYRASRGNENDIKKLQELKDTSANRVKGGAIALGAGVIGGIVGNIAINGNKKSKVKDLSDDEFKKFVSEQESSKKYSDKIKECLSSKMKGNNSSSLQDLVKECTK